jgi:two-component system cell cycle response regulator
LINRLDILSELDPLTKLLNRRALEARYSAIQESAGFDKQQLCLALVDIDNFKAINDSLGHASGDEVISGLSDVLKSSFRVSDLIARIGGDEFVVVALDCEAASASKLFETAQQRFENLVLRTDASDGNVTPSLSIGLLEYRGGEVSLREALKSADSLLYQAKQQGKKRIVAQDYFSVP